MTAEKEKQTNSAIKKTFSYFHSITINPHLTCLPFVCWGSCRSSFVLSRPKTRPLSRAGFTKAFWKKKKKKCLLSTQWVPPVRERAGVLARANGFHSWHVIIVSAGFVCEIVYPRIKRRISHLSASSLAVRHEWLQTLLKYTSVSVWTRAPWTIRKYQAATVTEIKTRWEAAKETWLRYQRDFRPVCGVGRVFTLPIDESASQK